MLNINKLDKNTKFKSCRKQRPVEIVLGEVFFAEPLATPLATGYPLRRSAKNISPIQARRFRDT